MKNIGILEVHCHVKFLYTMIKICKTKNTNVTIFTTEDLLSRLEQYLEDKEQYDFVLKKNNEGINPFLKRVEKICNDRIDLLFINTIQVTSYYLPKYFGFNPKCKMITTVHTANAWLNQMNAGFNLKKLHLIPDTFLSYIIVKFIILPKFDAINVLYSPIKDYILKETKYEKKIFTLPFNFFNGTKETSKKENKKIQFVIPGQIEEHRRDYETVINAFEQLLKNYNDEINLYLLGYPVGNYGNNILKRCNILREKGYNIIVYDKFVPEEKYNDIILNSDFIISPIRIKTGSWGVLKEIYGVTKASASVFEVLQYAKPLVVPNEFNIIEELESSTLKYVDSKDLENRLTEFIKNRKKLQDLKESAFKNSKYYSLPVLQHYFENEILSKLDSL